MAMLHVGCTGGENDGRKKSDRKLLDDNCLARMMAVEMETVMFRAVFLLEPPVSGFLKGLSLFSLFHFLPNFAVYY